MTSEQAKLVISTNLENFKRGAGYTDEVPKAIATLHKEWFGQVPAITCRECAISALNRVFKHYLNVYDTPTA